MNKKLEHYFTLNRRYFRSINLERDLNSLEALEGYLLTDKALDALLRISTGLKDSESTPAWTLTSVYGTGKSAFAHYIASLCASKKSNMRHKALEIAELKLGKNSQEYKILVENFPKQGYVRAVATATREPISNTIIRAILRGIESFWTPSQCNKQEVTKKLVDWQTEITVGKKVNNQEVLDLLFQVVKETKTGVFLIIDELGKNLEYTAYNQNIEDLYLLQQLAELPKEKNIYFLGILHQAFADYGQRLATIERQEWAKIQGRFENIPFTDSVTEMCYLIGEVIDCPNLNLQPTIKNLAQEWYNLLEDVKEDINAEIIEQIYPLHPLTGLVLPILCQRYGQSDRTLFTFLTSMETYSMKKFLTSVEVEGDNIPTLKLDRVYDYFSYYVGNGLASKANLQRWVEVENIIADASSLESDSLRVLKTIGILNLISTGGSLLATRKLVTLAMCDRPTESSIKYWQEIIDQLLEKNLITHRRVLDELRIWLGSDFNIESELVGYIELERSPLITILPPLSPIIAQRHSYRTGTLRYFERRYFDDTSDLTVVECPKADGLIGYWVGERLPLEIPPLTKEGKPLIVICGSKLDMLRIRGEEKAALQKMLKSANQLKTDGVARQEVSYRLQIASRLLEESLNLAFAVENNITWIDGKPERIKHISHFKSILSQECDLVYHKTPTLWNELINRRELTAIAVKARRELIEAMLNFSQANLGLKGFGPEVMMYYSILSQTGIHRQKEGKWGFYPPEKTAGIYKLWEAIEEFCLQAKEKPITLDKLYNHLAAPPYGVKLGVIPVVLTAVLLYHIDDIGVYRDGTFIPVLESQHLELLVKDQSKYAVKYFDIVGKKKEVFQELEKILSSAVRKKPEKIRNATLLNVVTPLYQLLNKLPAYTKKTQRLSNEAYNVLKTLQETREPDELIFTKIPQAMKLESGKSMSESLVKILQEIQMAYERLLKDCRNLIYEAFQVNSLEELGERSKNIVEGCFEPNLKRFINSAIANNLEALLMIVADKPPESWTDEDVAKFESNIVDLARRFKKVEGLQKEVKSNKAVKITLTHSNGIEKQSLVWLDDKAEEEIEYLIEKVLEEPLLQGNIKLQQAFMAKLTQRLIY